MSRYIWTSRAIAIYGLPIINLWCIYKRCSSLLVTLKKMTGETPEVRSDKRKPREKKDLRVSGNFIWISLQCLYLNFCPICLQASGVFPDGPCRSRITFRWDRPGQVMLSLMRIVSPMMGATFQTAPSLSTRITLYPTTTSIPQVRFIPLCKFSIC